MTWDREIRLVLGRHAVLTDQGWMDADEAEEGCQILDEVYAPPKEPTKP